MVDYLRHTHSAGKYKKQSIEFKDKHEGVWTAQDQKTLRVLQGKQRFHKELSDTHFVKATELFFARRGKEA